MVKVAVIGAGIIGLSSAVRIQEEAPDAEITLIAEKFSPETTSDLAAGIWGPYLLGDTPPGKVNQWSEETHNFLCDTYNTRDGGKLGISMLPCWRVSSSENYPEPSWKDIVYGFRELTEKELRTLRKPSLRKGHSFVTYTCEGQKLLPHFMQLFKSRGGQVIQGRVESIPELRKSYDVVVNCVGLQAHFLVNDKLVQPKRGQIMRVHAPHIKFAILDDDEDGNYIIPNQDSTILGGTHQEGDWKCSLYPEDTKFIREGCAELVPSVKDAPVLRELVGLRPGRPSVRLEMEVIQYPGEKPFFVCSNYGHGGSGLTLFWGCAKEAATLVKEAMGKIRHQSKL